MTSTTTTDSAAFQAPDSKTVVWIGIGVACGVLVIAVGIGAIAFAMRRRRRQANVEPPSQHTPAVHNTYGVLPTMTHPSDTYDVGDVPQQN
jgi:hypothetical protein